MELRDEELLLRPLTPDDVPAVVAACQDPELARFIPGFPSPYTESHARSWIDSRANFATSRTFLIVNRASGDLYGAIEVRLGEIGSIGYWIAAQGRGRGLATRAARLLPGGARTEGGGRRAGRRGRPPK